MKWLTRGRILVPVDYSEASCSAVDVALSLVEDAEKLHVLHVARAVVKGDPGFPWNPLGEATQRMQHSDAVRERLISQIEAGVHIEIAFGDPGQEIARFAEAGDFDLIVMPSHGRAGLSRLLIGSVAERVTRLAHCPVLILRG